MLRDQYIYQLETDLKVTHMCALSITYSFVYFHKKLLRGQVQDLSERKSSLEVANETLIFQMKTFSNKVQREFELKYQRDIRDYKAAFKSLPTKENSRPEKLQGSLRNYSNEESNIISSTDRNKTITSTDKNKVSTAKAYVRYEFE